MKVLFFVFHELIISQVQTPIPVPAQDPKTKSECYGIFCLTYDLKAVSFSSSLSVLGFWAIIYIYICLYV